ncbi:hypothetical protein COCON_G00211950 [Conger conger]|uniref:Uncharacterized protein n=1 Tax=Conger conger TaxID=82655 RepID=A0A9Q1D197_CONCO|nr:hypothetical protein COCON_G00211950 [Conger conger]
MSGNGNHCPAHVGHIGGFPVPHYSYFFPTCSEGCPPTLQGLPLSITRMMAAGGLLGRGEGCCAFDSSDREVKL